MPEGPVWLPVVGAPDYQVSDRGDVLSPSGKLLRQNLHKGQLRVRVRGKKCTVWKLVLEAFAGRPVGGGYRPWHLNGNIYDNRYENLAYRGLGRGSSRPRRTTTASHSRRVDHCRLDHELIGENVETWGSGNNRICVRCRNGRRS